MAPNWFSGYLKFYLFIKLIFRRKHTKNSQSRSTGKVIMLGMGFLGSGCLLLNRSTCNYFYRKKNLPPREKELLGFMTHLPLQKVYQIQTSILSVKRSRTSRRSHLILWRAPLSLSLCSLLEASIFYYYGL